jgi:hypothetical protein
LCCSSIIVVIVLVAWRRSLSRSEFHEEGTGEPDLSDEQEEEEFGFCDSEFEVFDNGADDAWAQVPHVTARKWAWPDPARKEIAALRRPR